MESLLDPRTVALTTAFTIAVCCVCLVLLWRILPSVEGPAHWSAGTILLAIGLTLIGLRDIIADSISILFGSAGMFGGFGLILVGVYRFCGYRHLWRVYVPGLLAVLLATAFLTYVVPTLQGRLVFHSFVLSAMSFATAAMLWRHQRPHLGLPQYFLSLTLGFEGLVFAARGVITGLASQSPTVLMDDRLSVYVFMQANLIAIFVLFGLSLLTNRKLQVELRYLARHDSLTQALNRRAFEDIAARELANAERYGYPVTLLVFDLDHFKQVNDRFGHAVGDQVLRAFSDKISASLRGGDAFARTGGEEFCALLTNTDRAGALTLADRLRREVAELRQTGWPEPLTISVSVGVASTDDGLTAFDALMVAADRALYHAKATGRNRVSAHADATANQT